MESNDNTANSPQGVTPVSDKNSTSKTEVSKWPISPTFLSLRKGKTEEDADYNNDGIFYTDYLRGFLADLSHDTNVQNALSLFQFVPEDFLPHDPNAEDNDTITTDPNKATVILNDPLKPEIEEILKKQHKIIIRIDSGTFINNGKLCDAFRRIAKKNTSYCFKQDSIVGIFADEELNLHDSTSKEYKDRLDRIIAEYNLDRDEKNAIKLDEVESEKGNRLYIHYTCPVSLYEEHTFPIYINGKIIACLMLGQMAREYFNVGKSFSDYREKMFDKSGRLIDFESIKIEYCRTTNEWEKKAQAIAERLDIFEKRIEDRIEHRNNRFIYSEFAEIEKIFRKDVKKINIKKQDAVSIFTKALNKAFDSIKTKFDNSGDGFIRMFAMPIDIKHEELVLIGWSGAEFDAKADLKFDLKQLKDLDKLQVKEIENRVLEAASPIIKEKFDKRKGDIFLPGWLAGSEVAYIVWKRHDKELKKNKKTFNTYKKALRDFYSVALECYSYIRGAKMELLLETTIQESAHESAHFILPAIDVVEQNLEPIRQNILSLKFIERFFKDKEAYVQYKELVMDSFSKKYDKYLVSFNKYKDEVLESLDQLREINYGSSLIFSPYLQINKSTVQVFDLLYKLKKTLNSRALDSHKSIYYSQKENYVKANIDAKYFNHALYNLLDNAIKYGYEGSYIRINMDVNRKEEKLMVTVVSYGIGIEENDNIYKLFERSEAAANIARGTGLGLYIVMKICEAHGGIVSHKSEKLSDYNIPVLFNYKPRPNLANKLSLGEITKLDKEISKLSGPIEREVVYDTRFISLALVFSERIYIPTYRNTFYIHIPLF